MNIEKICIPTLLKNLAKRRPVFHFEADFQLTLAQYLRETYPHFQVYLEYPLNLPNGDHNCDIVLLQDNKFMMAIELKYLVKELKYENKGELFMLKEHGAQNFGRRDILRDVEHMEYFLEKNPKAQASVIVVTNQHIYWKGSRKGTADEEFDIRNGTIVTGKRDWKKGTRNHKEGSHVDISGKYRMKWRDYSQIDRKFGLFLYLHIPVQPNASAENSS